MPHPKGWVQQGRASGDHMLQLRIGLPQPNFPALEKHLYEVSDPEHERYGAHLSKGEVEELIAPSAESIDTVDEWLASHGLSQDDFVRSPAKDWVTVRVPVSLAEKMLDTVSFCRVLQEAMSNHSSPLRLTKSGFTARAVRKWSGR